MTPILATQNIHQYIDRATGNVVTETLVGDKAIAFLYNHVRENAPRMFKALTSNRMSELLAFYQYDMPKFRDSQRHNDRISQNFGIDPDECVEPPEYFTCMRRVFERQIKFWNCRPMEENPHQIVSPADARLLIGSFSTTSSLFIKNKFFDLTELLGAEKPWQQYFISGDFAVFRLTPDKYHYNHVPVSGRVADVYVVDGEYHSCNPLASIAVASIHSKNRRVVTIMDTDVQDGSWIGWVAMVEIVALMIGDIKQAYSQKRYEDPMEVHPGLFMKKGCAKSLYRPGSSTDVLIFEPGKIRFCHDLIENSRRNDVLSRFRSLTGRPLVETDIRVRSKLAVKIDKP
jgi:phosphatidylserine decarboxylase